LAPPADAGSAHLHFRPETGTRMNVVAFTHALKALGRDIMNSKHEPETPFLGQVLTNGPVCLHLGASDGRHSFAMIKAGAAVVHAFEPATFSLEALKLGISLRGLGGRVIPVHGAVSDKPGTLELVTPKKSTGKKARAYAFVSKGGDTDRADFQGVGHFTETVPVFKLDDLNYARVDFIRMDIEGAEHAAMQGASSILHRDKPHILIEVHPVILKQRFGTSAEALAEMFRGLGYRFFAVENGKIVERQDFAMHREYGDFFLIHPDRALPPGVFKDFMAKAA
jgi:FkbM family methyltransferase